MARKSSMANTPGRGTRKQTVLTEPTPMAITPPKKRGRPATQETVTTTEPLKKRGRPARVQAAQETAIIESPRRSGRTAAAPEPVEAEAAQPTKRPAGRPPREKPTTQDDHVAPKKLRGRPPRTEQTQATVTTMPKRRGRPARADQTVDLNRVSNVGSPRVAKRKSTRSKKTAATSPSTARNSSSVRSKALALKKKLDHPQPAKRRGRPPKDANKATSTMPVSKRGRISKVSQSKTPEGPQSAAAKVKTPRKKRGYTVLEVPDKFVDAMKLHLRGLQKADRLPTPIDDEEVQLAAGMQQEVQRMLEGEDNNREDDIGEDVLPERVAALTAPDVAESPEGATNPDETGLNFEEFEDDLQPPGVHNEVSQEVAPEEATEIASQVDVEYSVHEEVQLGRASGDVDAVVEEVEEQVELHGPASLLDPAGDQSGNDSGDDFNASIQNLANRQSVGTIFA